METSGAVSCAAAPDGSVEVVILGTAGATEAARKIAGDHHGGTRVTATVPGGVGFVILDRRSGATSVVTPPIGLRQVYWRQHANRLSVASMPAALFDHDEPPGLCPDALFQYVYFHMVPGPTCMFAGAQKLDEGHTLGWDGRDVGVERNWLPRFDDIATLDESAAAEALRTTLRSAVGRCLEGATSPGAFLSGGLDSSTVSGFAAELRPGLPTISMGFDAAGYDEMAYARMASARFATTPIEYYVTPGDVYETLPMIASAFPEPFGNSSAAAAYHCARVARDNGVTRLLAGDGGDEIFGGNERYAKQLVFERYGSLPHGLRVNLVEPIVRSARAITSAFPVGKAASYIRQANTPLPDRLQSYNFLHQHAPEEVFAADFLAQVDSSMPLQLLREEYAAPATDSHVNRMLFLDWKFTLHDNDLVKVNHMCHLGGADVAYPMLDPAVVDFSLRIPGPWKVRGRQLRWFYKRAMEGFLPPQIISKSKHGFGLPFGVWTRTDQRLRRLSEDALANLRERGFFRPQFLDTALRMHREGHAAYYGELVWILMVLEVWLRQHLPGARL